MAQLDPKLLEILACPADHHAPVTQEGDVLVCTECGLRFPIRDGIPVMLLDDALPAVNGS
ncbi:MAG: Trm112 family protein [Candidatus Nanopelagicales bacterium]